MTPLPPLAGEGDGQAGRLHGSGRVRWARRGWGGSIHGRSWIGNATSGPARERVIFDLVQGQRELGGHDRKNGIQVPLYRIAETATKENLMNAPEFLPPRRELKDHELVETVSRPNLRYEKRPATRPDGSVASGLYNAWITLDNPGQFNSYTTDMVKGVILAFRAASNARDVNCIVLHRRRRQGLLHRRQHQGVRRVLRRPPAGVPPVHAAVQRHGHRHPRLRQAGDLPRQRHAHRRRPGDRHGLRLLGRAGPGALRPGRPQARLGADRRRDRLPAADGRRRARDGGMRPVRAVLRAQGLPDGRRHRHRSGAEGRRQVHRQPDGRDAARLRRVRPCRLRRAQDRRGRARSEGGDGGRDDRPVACSTRRSRSCAPRCC